MRKSFFCESFQTTTVQIVIHSQVIATAYAFLCVSLRMIVGFSPSKSSTNWVRYKNWKLYCWTILVGILRSINGVFYDVLGFFCHLHGCGSFAVRRFIASSKLVAIICGIWWNSFRTCQLMLGFETCLWATNFQQQVREKARKKLLFLRYYTL